MVPMSVTMPVNMFRVPFCYADCGNATTRRGQGDLRLRKTLNSRIYDEIHAESPILTTQRNFLFLQGPHGPFFRRLASKLTATGAKVGRIGFNRGDSIFWRGELAYTPFTKRATEWPAFLETHLDTNAITDIVLYGDSRPLHRVAREIAAARGITVHCFEEGYLRPYWATYERGGTNGNSALMGLSIAQMRAAIEAHPADPPEAPTQWGSVWHHAYYGFWYHLFLSFRGLKYRHYRSHRQETVLHELALYLRKLAIMPLQGIQRRVRTRRLLRSGAIYHLVLLQLSHDASLKEHSKFNNVGEFIDEVVEGFAAGAPAHHHLVFKAHPFEDGREPLPAQVCEISDRLLVRDRVHYIPGGKLGPLLDGANSAVTVNSTAAQQALWRGLPVRAFGTSVFDKPELVSHKPLAGFFADPDTPDADAYHCYRHFLLETSQIAGGYYTQKGRAELLRRVVDLMLSLEDLYGAGEARGDATDPVLQVVSSWD